MLSKTLKMDKKTQASVTRRVTADFSIVIRQQIKDGQHKKGS